MAWSSSDRQIVLEKCALTLRYRLLWALFLSCLLHGLLATLLFTISKQKTQVLGNLIGNPRLGVVAYLAKSRDSSAIETERNKTQTKIKANSSLPISVPKSATPELQKISSDAIVKGIPLSGGITSFSDGLSMNLLTGRANSIWGLPSPVGVADGKIPLEAEWALRRQIALNSLEAQLTFMRQFFLLDDDVDCTVRDGQVTCSPENNALSTFLRFRFEEVRMLDPSLSVLRWLSHGSGSWTFELL